VAPAQVTELTRDQAVAALARAARHNADGLATPENVADAGMTLRLDVDGGHAVMVLTRRGAGGRQLWVEGAVGGGDVNMTAIGLRFIEDTARYAGCSEVAFQTSRRGLVRKTQRLGYQVQGFILRKALT
jgi:hypothetical protein